MRDIESVMGDGWKGSALLSHTGAVMGCSFSGSRTVGHLTIGIDGTRIVVLSMKLPRDRLETSWPS
jgi:hypothetical protein